MSQRQNLARMLRQALLNDAAAVIDAQRERKARDLEMPPPEPPEPLATQPAAAPTTLSPPTLLTRARTFLAHTLAEPPPALDTLILWALHTYAYARFEVSPRLILHGRDATADHARALRLLRWLTPSPRLFARATAANVVELIAHENPTLLLDDAANAILGRRDMRALIAAGAHADGALLGKRTRKKDGAVRRCAAPLALATAASPPEELLAHAIVIPMAPALDAGEGRARGAIAEPPAEALALRAEFATLGAKIRAANANEAVAFPTFLGPTAAETWGPLFICARALGAEAETAVRIAASQFANPEHLEPPTSARALLRDIRRIAGIDGTHASSNQLVDALTRDPDSPWNACDYGAKLTPRGLAKRLARFEVRPQVIHLMNAPSFRGYKADALLTAYARYLNDPVARALLQAEGPTE
jgi:hypothetical protein